MRCILIIPPWSPEEIFPSRTAGSQLNYWQPLGLLYVAASLRQAGHDVSFLDGAFMTHEDMVRRVREARPGFVGLYSTTFGWPAAVRTAAAVKSVDAGIFTCVGGPYPTAVPDNCLGDGGQRRHVDAVVVGEGERTVTELVDRLAAGGAPDGISGVIFRNGTEIVRNPLRPLLEDLDALPFPARDLLEDQSRYLTPPATYRRKPVAVVLTSRGCNRHCIYCSQMDRDRKAGIRGVRFRSLDNVLEEIEECLRQGYREIKFIDDSFAADYGRAMRLCRAIKARRLDFPWFASACANQVDAPLLRAMKDAGCWAVLIGAESGVQRNLNTLRKGVTLDQIRGAVRAAKNVGLKVTTPFLLGIPGETAEDIEQTVDFAIELDPDLANFHMLTPFPGTDLYDHSREYGTLSDDLRDYTYQGAAFVPHTMTRNELLTRRRLAFRRFYSRPSFILRKILGIRTAADLKGAVRGARSLFWIWADREVFHRRKQPTAPTPAGSSLHSRRYSRNRAG